MSLQRVLLAACLMWAVSSAGADVTAIGPFTGDASEGFENIIPPGPYAGPMPIFGSADTIDDFYTDPWIATVLSGGGYELYPYNGNLMGLTPTGWTVFDFDTPVLKFGGYMGTVNAGPPGDVTFFDNEGVVIETQAFSLPQGDWAWRGWESDVPVGSILIHTGANPGFTGVYDDLQVSYVPEPGAAALLAIGAALTIWRRR